MKSSIWSIRRSLSFCSTCQAFLMDTSSYRNSWLEPGVHSTGCLLYHLSRLATLCRQILAHETDCLGLGLDAILSDLGQVLKPLEPPFPSSSDAGNNVRTQWVGVGAVPGLASVHPARAWHQCTLQPTRGGSTPRAWHSPREWMW